MDSTSAIHAVLKTVGQAFSALDFDQWIACFHAPRTVIFPDRIFTSASNDETRALFQPFFDKLRSKGFTRTQLDRCSIRMLTETTAIADTLWTRFGENDVVLE